MKDEDITVFQCQCTDASHQLTVRYSPAMMDRQLENWWPPDLYVTTYLNSFLPWYSRLWAGLKYILGVRDVSFDCTLINVRDAPKLAQILDDYTVDTREYNEEYAAQRKKAKAQ